MKNFNKVFTVIVLLFLYIPMIVLAVGSFNSGMDIAVFKGFTLDNYSELFSDSVLLPLLLNSVIVALLSSIFATILGTCAALGIHSMGPRLRRFTMGVTNIPLTNPEIVTGVSLALLFAFVGTMLKINNILGFATLLIAHITFNLPYVILSVLPKLRQTDTHLAEAAQDLGCTPVQSFFKVILPNISSGIITGFIMAFTLSLDDFIISYFVSGPKFQTLPIVIFSMTKKKVKPDMYALSTLIFVAVLVLLVLMNIMQVRSEKKEQDKQEL